MKTTPQCIECQQNVSRREHEFSLRDFGHSLCIKCQYKLDRSGATDDAIGLYLALKSGNIHVVPENNDGNKTVDIDIPGKLNIGVNGGYPLANYLKPAGRHKKSI